MKHVLCLGVKFDILQRIKNLGYKIILIDENKHNEVNHFISLNYSDARDENYDLKALSNQIQTT